MSRETKIGMVVAASFLALVGVVVVTKWKRGTDPNTASTQQVNQEKSQPQDNPPPKPEVKSGGVVNAGLTVQESNPPPLLPVPNDASNSAVALPPLPTAGAATDMEAEEARKRQELLAKIKRDSDLNSPPPLPTFPAVPDAGKKFDEAFNNTLAKIDDAKNKGANTVNDAGNRANELINKGNDNVNNAKVNDSINKANNLGAKAANTAANKFDELTNKGNNAVNKGIDPLNKGVDNVKQLPLPPVVDANPMLPPISPSNVGGANTPLPPSPAPPPGNANNNAPTLPLPPVGANNNPVVPAVPTPGSNQDNAARPVIPAPTNPPQLPMITDNKPSVAIPAPKVGDARVQVHDVQSYQVRGGETFASVSKTAYGSEKYANALLAYNREYSANRNLTNLQAGQTIMLPSAEFLQSKYPNAITAGAAGFGNTPNPGGINVASNTSVSIAAPVPSVPKTSFGPTTPSPDVTKNYRVAAQGQMVYEIAIQTLGDGNRWPEILRLNPNMQPLQPIPGGTILRLPGNANVP